MRRELDVPLFEREVHLQNANVRSKERLPEWGGRRERRWKMLYGA